MGRGPKPTKAKTAAKRPVTPKHASSQGRGFDKQLAEARAQQAATAEILRVIGASPTDPQPVFDAIMRSAVELCEGLFGGLFRVDGDMLHMVADHNYSPEARVVYRQVFPMALTQDSRRNVSARAVIDRTVVHLSDIRQQPDFGISGRLSEALKFRAILSVPMVRDGSVVGVITVARAEAGSFSESQVALLQTFADQAVIAIENVRLFNETKEALERQTATSEILRIISESPTDVQPVLDAVAQNASRLCGAMDTIIRLREGDELIVRAHLGPIPIMTAGRAHAITRGWVGSRAVLERRVVHVHDLMEAGEEFPEGHAVAIAAGHRTTLAVPLLREGEAIGVILIRRTEIRPFSEKEIALLKTFADQAVIAIENVRLFKELEEKNRAQSESLEQQTATSQILRVISSSPTDIQPVFDAVVESAAQLCEANDVAIYRREGDRLRFVAHQGSIPPPGPVGEYVRPLERGSVTGRSVLEARLLHVADVQTKADEFPTASDLAQRLGFRTLLSVPLIREGTTIGTIMVRRTEARLFTERQVALLQTFADQAVIAIENVRLFTELQEKNRALTEAHAQVTESLEQQTATSEILRVISSSPTDVQPVFDVIIRNAVQLCGGLFGCLFRFDGERLHLVAHHNFTPEAQSLYERTYPVQAAQDQLLGPIVLEQRVMNIADVLQVVRNPLGQRLFGFRSGVGGPMVRDGTVIGAIAVSRKTIGLFPDTQVELLRTFADQAVIAIENVRLFTETKEALERQTATSEILRVISQSPTDVQPVFDTIVSSAAALCHASDVIIVVADGDSLRFGASVGPVAASVGQSQLIQDRGLPLTRGSVSGRAVIDRRTVHIHDVSATPDDEFPEGKRLQQQYGGRGTTLAVPLLRDDVSLGVITLVRSQIRPFTDQQVAILETFADQAVIAIENVRLFRELQEKNRALTEAHAQVTESLDQQTATSEILSVISGSPTNIQPVFDTVAKSAARLCEASDTSIFRLDGDRLRRVAHHGSIPAGVIGEFAVPLVRGSFAGRCVLDGRIVHIADGQTETNEFPEGSEAARRLGFRAILLVPLLREGVAIGVITLRRTEPRLFTEQQVTVLKTFADQAVIAIENVRLFTELQARTQDLTRSVGQLTALGEVGRAVSSTLDLETVLSTIVSRAIQLSGTDGGSVYEYDEATEEFSLRASRGLPDGYIEQVRDTRPRKGDGAVGRVAQTREPVQIVDISDATAYESRVRNILLQMGLRALLAVPLIAEDHLVGALIVMRKRTGSFADEEVALLQTFATQSALAIQNARLFREIEDKSRQLEVASQHKSEFLANMSHELRTPLNAIIGFSEVLSEKMFGELNEKQEEYSKDIHASGQHLLSLINDILDLSKIEAGRMELELSDFDLPTAIDNAVMLVRERAGRRNLTLHRDVDGAVGQVRADERKVRQVVLNLLSNAIKFTPEGGRIEIRATPQDGLVEVSVSDTGVGIAPEDQEAVFEEFRQVGTADKKVEGTGLGLTLCRKFVELHGGRIWVKSEVGAGSTFTFTIPVRLAE